METVSLYIEDHGEARQQIIRAALTRFARFGAKKTTVQEIAKDAHVSIPLLKSIFPNKTVLTTVAIAQIVRQEWDKVLQLQHQGLPILQKFYRWMELKDDLRRTYSMGVLLYANKSIYEDIPREAIEMVRSNEIEQLGVLFQQGIDDGELRECPVRQVSELFADILHGLVMLSSTKWRRLSLQEDRLLEEVLSKQKEVAEIFINGLKFPAGH